MKLNGKRVAGGLAAAGLAVAGLAGGGVALASARTPATPATLAAVTALPYPGWCLRDPGGMPGMFGTWTGQPLAGLARAQHKPVPGLQDAMAAAMASRINASHALTAAQKAAMLRAIRDHLDDMINAVPGSGAGMGWMSRTGGMGMGYGQDAGADR